MITVVGSLNIDLTVTTKKYPELGETIMGESFQTNFGGKGANQALAAAKLGGDVQMVGCVGDDSFGEDYKNHLTNAGIIVEHVETVTGVATGIANITVSEGDNAIVVVSGANYKLTPEMIVEKEELIANSSVVVLQLEVPVETVEKVLEIANKHHVTSILNPAPFHELPEKFLEMATYLTPNEHEAKGLMDSQYFSNKYLNKLIVTIGAQGAAFYQDGKKQIVPAPAVDVVDTTGAGDTFNGALAYFLDAGNRLEEAIRKAVYAASLSVTKFGAQGGMPTLGELEEFMEKNA